MKILKMVLPVLVLFLGTSAAFAEGVNLVNNGGFETGNFTGWTQGGNRIATTVSDSTVNTGSFAAALGPVGSDGNLSQTLNTVAGQAYTITFYLFSGTGIPNDFSMLFNNEVLFTQTNIPYQPYTLYTFTGLATTSWTTLEFEFRDDPSYLRLDDVKVVVPSVSSSSTPEPSSIILLGSGLLGLGGMLRRKFALSA